MIESLPTILGYAFENIDAKIAGLGERGFSNPHKMIETSPAILGYAFENIDAKLAGLGERGFGNPKKMIESLPAILNYTFKNIDAKLAGLRERGFGNPNKMIESSPTILCYTFKNIDRRLHLFSKLIRLYNLPFDPTELMERDSSLFSNKIDKLMVLVRILRDYKVTLPDLNEEVMNEEVISRLVKLISRLVKLNVEDTLVALSVPHDKNESILGLIHRTSSIRKQKLPKDIKRQIIQASLDEASKIKSRYFRGYPDKI
ncbi:hypothetical protein C4577_07095 [Candidatus Parcubacteria bacterium]|nr:MAG: hypothetical protein C4577_07095 [Candidatus Parcubacteria bacterium]